MTDHPTHKLDTYRDGFHWIVFCKRCSAEGDLLAEPCPGHYISPHEKNKTIDTIKEPN